MLQRACCRSTSELTCEPHHVRSAGLNIYLVSRTEAKLTAAAEEIKAAYRVETKIFVADLVAAGALADSGAAWFGLKSNLDGLDVGVLVNNAGMSYEHPEFLHNVDAKALNDIVAINAVALTQMVHVVLPGMKERGRGCVVNISSGVSAALPACPLLAVYAASKAYVDALTAALAAEYSHFGIRFQVRWRTAGAFVCACVCEAPGWSSGTCAEPSAGVRGDKDGQDAAHVAHGAVAGDLGCGSNDTRRLRAPRLPLPRARTPLVRTSSPPASRV